MTTHQRYLQQVTIASRDETVAANAFSKRKAGFSFAYSQPLLSTDVFLLLPPPINQGFSNGFSA